VAAALEAVEAGFPLASAITGPAARGDHATVARQLEALRQAAPEKAPLAGELVQETLRQVARIGRKGGES
jgi:predicted short-subunit dehydrogenase-like oxidoreductase (DUF2520 family)